MPDLSAGGSLQLRGLTAGLERHYRLHLGARTWGGDAFGGAVLLVFLPPCSEAWWLGHWLSAFFSLTAAIVFLLFLGRARRHGAPWPGRVTRERCECRCPVGPGWAYGWRGVDSLDKDQETLRTWAGEWVPRWRESQGIVRLSGRRLACWHLGPPEPSPQGCPMCVDVARPPGRECLVRSTGLLS